MDLPRDIELKLVRLLDIDTRRIMGIYSKIYIPDDIRIKLERFIHNERIQYDEYESTIIFSLPPIHKKFTCILRHTRYNDNTEFFMSTGKCFTCDNGIWKLLHNC